MGKNTTSENFPVPIDWAQELLKLRDQCLVCHSDTNEFEQEFGDGELTIDQLKDNLIKLLNACNANFGEIAQVQLSNGSEEWLDFTLPKLKSRADQYKSNKKGKKK